MIVVDWNEAWPIARQILASAPRGTRVSDLVDEVERATGFPMTAAKIADACRRREVMTTTELIGNGARAKRLGERPTDPAPPPMHETRPQHISPIAANSSPPVRQDGMFDDLMRLCKRGVDFGSLCDRLDMSPRRVRALIEEAQGAGYRVEVNGDTIEWGEDNADTDDGETVNVPLRQVDGWTKFVVFSDTHFGSKFCMRKQIRDFLRYAVDKRGCTLALHAGDWTEGVHPKVRGELSHHNFTDQMADMHEWMPHDIEVVSIFGNHDAWHARDNGMDVARAMNDTLRGYGRTNIRVVGGMNKLLQVGGLKVRLTHPAGGTAYAKSYPAQKWTRDLESASGRKPHLWFFGHRHRYVHFVDRGMHVFDVPCWQGGGSDYGKRLHGAPAIGGIIVEAGQLDNGIVRAIRLEPVMYYEAEDVEPVPIRRMEYEIMEPSHVGRSRDVA